MNTNNIALADWWIDAQVFKFHMIGNFKTNWLKPQHHCQQLNPSAEYSAAAEPPRVHSPLGETWPSCKSLCSTNYKSEAIIQPPCFDTAPAWFTALLLPISLISDFQIRLFSNLTDFPLFQVEHIYLPGPTDWDGGADRLTPGIWRKNTEQLSSWCLSSPDTRRLSWKRNFTRITTSPGDAGSRWPTSSVSQRDKSKFGSRTGETFCSSPFLFLKI